MVIKYIETYTRCEIEYFLFGMKIMNKRWTDDSINSNGIISEMKI